MIPLPPQHRVHADSVQMIPDSEKRLAQAVADLEDLVVSPARRLAPKGVSNHLSPD